MWPLWYAHADGEDGDTQDVIQMQEGDGDAPKAERRGDCQEVCENGVRLVIDGG